MEATFLEVSDQVERESIPEVYVSLLPNGLCEFYCQYCGHKHVHGFVPGYNNWHRIAHCTGDSPYRETGYFLRLAKGWGHARR